LPQSIQRSHFAPFGNGWCRAKLRPQM
jgi:hypothetical protein